MPTVAKNKCAHLPHCLKTNKYILTAAQCYLPN